MSPLLIAIAPALVDSLVLAVWWGALVALVGVAAMALLPRRAASARHAVGLACLVAMAAWPVAHLAALLIDAHAAAPAAAASALRPGSGLSTTLHAAPPALPCDAIAALYLAGMVATLARLAGGVWLLRAFARRPTAPLPPAWDDRADAIRRAFGIARPVAIHVVEHLAQPFAAHVLRPAIWLPAAALLRLAPDELDAVLAHELAHVRRADWLWNGLQCAVEALLFFHPAAWLLGRRVRAEREHACDDLAAAHCGDGLALAQALASLARMQATCPAPRLALGARGGVLRERIARLVGAPPQFGWRAVGTAFACGALLAAGLMAAPAGIAAPAPAADPWWTTVGDSMRMRFSEDGHVREYHVWRDLSGDRHETFRVDGALRPVDDDVRRWVQAHREKPPVPPLPPAPPLPPGVVGDAAAPAPAAAASTARRTIIVTKTSTDPLPPLAPLPLPVPAPPGEALDPLGPPSPPLPPLPPLPPEIGKSPAFEALAQRLAADPAALQALGSPIALDDDCSPCRLEEARVSLALTAHGPLGRARVDAVALSRGGEWRIERLALHDVHPAP